ncbi:sugar kinase [Allorhizocola rhizosphaerae]|uniref:sugar kinase n=1 Tax=Allorhizocola rhizosphaerae TaxID=1872709 RepID=UPI000E3D6100|nr:sugar kinase [Allorhizocola rhizosphaerae]
MPQAVNRLDILGFGEAMVLFEARGLEAASNVDVSVAGAELNLCAAAARAGASTALCTRVGDDPLGRRVLAEAEALGVSTALIQVDPTRPTGLFLKDIQPDGQRRVHYYRRGSAASAMDDASLVLQADPRLVAISGITPMLGDGPLSAVFELARSCRLAFDPNFRPAFGVAQIEVARELLPHVDILILGMDEAGPLLGAATPEEVFAAFRSSFSGEVVVKAGPDGCYVPGAHLPSVATSIVDPVGAGDAFGGGYLAARLRGLSQVDAARLGNELAACVIAAPGDTAGLADWSPAGQAATQNRLPSGSAGTTKSAPSG